MNCIAFSQQIMEENPTKKKVVVNDSLYQSNIKKSRLYGVYIPKDIPDALSKLMELTDEEARNPMKKVDEATIAKRLFFGLGRWMEYNWNFEEGSRFSHHLRELGLTFPEDMVTCMLILFHRYVNEKPLNEKSLIDELSAKRKTWLEAQEAKKEVLSTETRKIENKGN